MRIAEINASNYGSTGHIMLGVTSRLRQEGHQVLVCYPATLRNKVRSVDGSYFIGNQVGRNIDLNLSKWTGREDRLFRCATRKLIRRLEDFRPDVIHLHNIHGWYLNFPLFFDYIKQKQVRVVWTLHDCWPITGHCPHFDMIGCDKWKTQCGDCPIFHDYPQSRVDNSFRLHRLKKDCFRGVKDLTVVTPSAWMADIVSHSFLKDYPTEVIHNGIDLDIFKPTTSEFRKRYHCEDKIILLGVAFGWTVRKGLDVFVRLAADLDDRYQIVLVGTDEEVDRQLPKNILSIHRTHDRKELTAYYTAADLLVNPTREDTFAIVNTEALACGTQVLTFRTGGSPEIPDDTCGCVVDKNDYEGLKQTAVSLCQHPFPAEACRKRAEEFNVHQMIGNYCRLLLR